MAVKKGLKGRALLDELGTKEHPLAELLGMKSPDSIVTPLRRRRPRRRR